jgi:hypothetical protein
VSSDKQRNYTEQKKLGTNFVENRLIKLAKREKFYSRLADCKSQNF